MSTNRHVQVPSYRDLKWRLEIKTNTRASLGLSEPQYTIQLTTADKDGKTSTRLLTIDYANLRIVTEALEASYKAVRTAEYRRVARLVK